MHEDDFDRRRRSGPGGFDDRRGRDFGGNDRDRRYNGPGMKRSSSNRRDEGGVKRSRVDSACDSFEPQFLRSQVDEPQAPVMMTFKRFLATQDDSISDDDAIAKYSEYKQDFKRQELQKFFDAHKDEEWLSIAAVGSTMPNGAKTGLCDIVMSVDGFASSTILMRSRNVRTSSRSSCRSAWRFSTSSRPREPSTRSGSTSRMPRRSSSLWMPR
ncbi:hypothetical protein L596_020314 [Steinernema carpocapsae]|uniref:SERRATE/Ars2 N-terminal domain-containing protein n=1 Tax=Steinernema carpocapsae TaxID=34508 RepID=A0A4U5MT61_STECR|nr:hypothetical protein L596_020314 [Steinernema carpocapsae]